MSNKPPAVPFHSQHWDLGKWHELGFKDHEDAEYWMWSCCGVLCVQMAAEYFLGKEFQTSALIRQGQKLRAYTHKEGWSHAGLVKLANDLGLDAAAGVYSTPTLAEHITNGGLAIVSIKRGFERAKTLRERILFWKKYGGHLALVIGVKESKGKLEGFYVHHTSARAEYDWVNRFVPLTDFTRGYTGRAIVIHKKNRNA